MQNKDLLTPTLFFKEGNDFSSKKWPRGRQRHEEEGGGRRRAKCNFVGHQVQL